jgi:hypothetical protein
MYVHTLAKFREIYLILFTIFDYGAEAILNME